MIPAVQHIISSQPTASDKITKSIESSTNTMNTYQSQSDVESSLLLESVSINDNDNDVIHTNVICIEDRQPAVRAPLTICLVIAATLMVVAFTSQVKLTESAVSQAVLAESVMGSSDDYGFIETVMGVYGETGSANGAGTDSTFNSPYGLVMDDDSAYLYIADTENNLIRRYDSSTSKVKTYAGSGTAGLSNAATLLSSTFNGPQGLCYGSNKLYVIDTKNQVVRKIDIDDETVSTYAGTGVDGFSGDSGDATSATFSNPTNCVWKDDDIYISDTYNNRVRLVSSKGIISTYAGSSTTTGYSGDSGVATSAKLYYPRGMAMDSSKNLFIADSLNNAVRYVEHSTKIITTIVGTGSSGYSGDGGKGASAKLSRPDYLLLSNGENKLYISDSYNSVVRVYTVDDKIIDTQMGTGSSGYNYNDGEALEVKLYQPRAIEKDSNGDIYVADSKNSIIRLWYSSSPTAAPTHKPTSEPTYKPTDKPTLHPTHKPTHKPTYTPTVKPTSSPTTYAPSSSSCTTSGCISKSSPSSACGSGTICISTTLTSLSENAFSNLYNALTGVSFTGCTSLTTIGKFAFANDYKITSIDLSPMTSLTTIDGLAFYDNDGLKSVTFTGTPLQSIGSYAFYDADSLTTLTDFGSLTKLTTISDYCFYSAALTSVRIPASVTTINQYAFGAMSSLTFVCWEGSKPSSVSSTAFSGSSVTLSAITTC